jgi:PhnB protein
MPKRSLNSENVEQLNQGIEAMLAGAAQKSTTRTGEDTRAYIGNAEIAPLIKISAGLRELPREDFKTNLKKKLEGSEIMITATESPATTRVFAAPRITFKNAAKAMEFYKNAFGAKETFRFELESGIPHAEMTIGDSVIFVTEEWPDGDRYSAETLGNSPILMSIQVPDVDAFVAHAVAAGATLTMPPTDQFYGYRDAGLLDPFGYKWSVSTVKEEMSVEEMHRRFRAAMPAARTPEVPRVPPVPEGYRTLTPYIVAQDAEDAVGFLKQTFGAEETFRAVGGAGGLHCEVRLGDSMLMVGGGGPGLAWKGDSQLGAFHVYVRDCDAAYERALKAGATSIQKPTDQFYGERSGSVKDAAGNHWYIATRLQGDYKWEGAPDVQPYLHPLRGEPVINFLKRAFGAVESGRPHATPDGVIQHAMLKIGDSYLELGEAQGPYQPMHSMFYLYVPNCDAVYKRALAAGATSISEPKDQTYGDRSGGVKDVFGNQWYIATHLGPPQK